MKQPGFMLLETMIAMTTLALIAMFTMDIITTNLTRIRSLKTEYETLCEVKKRTEQALLFPLQKNVPFRLLQNESVTIKSQIHEISNRSSLKDFGNMIKIVHVTGHKTSHDKPMSLIGFVIPPPQQAEK